MTLTGKKEEESKKQTREEEDIMRLTEMREVHRIPHQHNSTNKFLIT